MDPELKTEILIKLINEFILESVFSEGTIT